MGCRDESGDQMFPGRERKRDPDGQTAGCPPPEACFWSPDPLCSTPLRDREGPFISQPRCLFSASPVNTHEKHFLRKVRQTLFLI